MNPFDELFSAEIGRLLPRYDTLRDARGEKGKIHHPALIVYDASIV
jgi:hypothetical protein